MSKMSILNDRKYDKKNQRNNVFLFFFINYIAIIIISFFYNYELFSLINGSFAGLLEYPMLLLSALADGIYILIIASLALQKKPENYMSFLVSFLVTSVIVHLIKYFFPIYRPSYYFGENNIFIAGQVLTWNTFPSGHSTAAMVLTRYLTFDQPYNYKFWAYLSFGLLCALSRVYIGAHYTFDIVVGAGLGFFVSDMIFRKMRKKSKSFINNRTQQKEITIYTLMIVLSTAYILTIAPRYKPLTIYLQISLVILSMHFLYKIYTTWKQINNHGNNNSV